MQPSSPPEPERLFPIEAPEEGRVKRAAVALAGPPLRHLLSLQRLEGLYEGLAYVDDCGEFIKTALDVLQIRVRTSPRERERIPAEGPLIIVSNHPYGGLDGLILARLLLQRRADVKILANYLLCRVPQLREILIPVDPWQRTGSFRSNALALRTAIRWTRAGGALAVFPAGEVSSFDLRRRCVIDPSWQATVGRLVRRTGATVLPVFFCGRNGNLFQLAGLVHPTLRTALLPHELLNKARTDIEVRVGQPLPAEDLVGLDTDERIATYLRDRTEILACRTPTRRRRLALSRRKWTPAAPLAGPGPAAAVAAELDALPPEQTLVGRGDLEVRMAHAWQIPEALLELGRLREVTFRAVGEGTGRARDLDRFDTHYDHLLLWDRQAREIVGAYRFARTDRVLPVAGPGGLYTSTLFRYDPTLFDRLGPALELGRSFVRAEHQRSFGPLLLLWQGIGRFVSRHPWYRTLFGPVSISRDYLAISRWLMVRYLQRHHLAEELAPLVQPRHPFRLDAKDPSVRYAPWLEQVDDLSGWVAHVETEQKGVPILLRHYLRLGGRLLSFNVDPAFNDCVDGLILVDLVQTAPRLLARFMKPSAAAAFRAFHGGRPTDAADLRAG